MNSILADKTGSSWKIVSIIYTFSEEEAEWVRRSAWQTLTHLNWLITITQNLKESSTTDYSLPRSSYLPSTVSSHMIARPHRMSRKGTPGALMALGSPSNPFIFSSATKILLKAKKTRFYLQDRRRSVSQAPDNRLKREREVSIQWECISLYRQLDTSDVGAQIIQSNLFPLHWLEVAGSTQPAGKVVKPSAAGSQIHFILSLSLISISLSPKCCN